MTDAITGLRRVSMLEEACYSACTRGGMDERDVTDIVLEGYAALPSNELKRAPSEPPQSLHPQAAEMFVWLAQHATHQIGTEHPNYLDYTTPLAGLALTNCLVACERSGVRPAFSRPTQPDPWVKAEFSRQFMAELNREQAARLRNGIWRQWYDRRTDVAHVRLTRRRRLSALTLLDVRAKSALLQQLLGKSLSDLTADESYHAFAASSEMLYFLTRSDPVGWSRFESAMGIDTQQLAALAGFLVFLKFAADEANHSFWYDEPFLLKLWAIFIHAFPQYASISSSSIVAAILKFSLTPSEAATSLMHPPFYQLYGKLLRNPCFLQANDPTPGLLTIAIRRNEDEWNNTLGSSLAQAADTLASMLPRLERLKVAVRRKFPGGDVDLALYDTVSRELLVCEVKTVYDKHRTDSLMWRFEEAKVNVERATSQLIATEQALNSGKLTLATLFGANHQSIAQIHKALLTWFDPIDVTMGTPHEDITSLNFSMFLCLIHAAQGDVRALMLTARELRNVWAVAEKRALDLGQPDLKADLESQVGLLDSRESLATLPLSPLTRNILAELETIDDASESHSWISYMADTRSALGGG